VHAGEVEKFVCAAGVLSHYIGDACQPLHISYMFNGDPDNKLPGVVRDPKTGEKSDGEVPAGTGVHAAYEEEMVDANVPAIMDGIDQRSAAGTDLKLVRGGHGAAVGVVQLMQKTFAAISPREIIDTFVPIQEEKPAARAKAMWQKLGERTIDVMSDGCSCLAQLWDSAWQEGDGDTNIAQFDAIDEATLEGLYRNPDFLHSYTLDTIGTILQNAPAAPPPPPPGPSAPARTRSPSKTRRKTRRRTG
jgi:hypothetical protein